MFHPPTRAVRQTQEDTAALSLENKLFFNCKKTKASWLVMVPRGWIMRPKTAGWDNESIISMHSLYKWRSSGFLCRQSILQAPPEAVLSWESLKNENKPNQIYTQCETIEIKIPPSFCPTKDCFVVMVGRAPNPGWSFVQQAEHEKETLMVHENKRVSLLLTLFSLCFNVICDSTWRVTTLSNYSALKLTRRLFFFSFLA